jgi:hypothetical protein
LKPSNDERNFDSDFEGDEMPVVETVVEAEEKKAEEQPSDFTTEA